jgi:predicted nucleic acid-binding protein
MAKRGLDTSAIVAFAIKDHSKHEAAVEILRASKELAIAPQVVSEFLHVITDSKRFESPLIMENAIPWIHDFLFAKEVSLVFPDLKSIELQLQWMSEFRLGRKRILDTQLAATYFVAGITEIITDNVRDFESLAKLTIIHL